MSRPREACVTCGCSVLRDRNRHILTREDLEARENFAEYVLARINIDQITFNEVQYMCHRCWVAAGRYNPRPESPALSPPRQQNQTPPLPELPQPQAEGPIGLSRYKRTANTSRRCLFPNCANQMLHRVPQFLKMHCIVEYKTYIPPLARVCDHHLRLNVWSELEDFSLSSFTPECIEDMLDMLIAAQRTRLVLDFDHVEEIRPDELYFRTGLTHNEFQRVMDETPSVLDQDPRRAKTVLGAYLMKIRSGEPDDRIACHLNMTRKTLAKMLIIARECLTAEFVPRHLGLDHISREDILRHTLTIPVALYGSSETEPQAIVVADGTYLFIQKSGNFLFQKRTYSLHKYGNLLKPFLFVCSDGYIIEITGPHGATTSDADIMNAYINQEDAPIHFELHEGDVYILDRGFRDAVENLESHGYEVHIPPTKSRHATQLSTEEANKSRLVTIVRWVVEVMNGRFKRDFKIFRNTYFNKSLPHIMTDFRIAGALLNTFREPLQDNPYADNIVEIIHERMNVPNRLGDFVVDCNVNRQRVHFQAMEESDVSFPTLNEEELILFSLGTYQIKLAKSYVSEHLRGGVYLIEVHVEAPSTIMRRYGMVTDNCTLIRGRVQSRHITNRKYYSYILVNNTHVGRAAIKESYCSCLTGRRTVGTCAHIMSFVWYLAKGRHEPFVGPAIAWDDIIIDDYA